MSAETSERILDSAETLFAARGIAAVSVRAVCEAAGVNAALPHYYFGTRDDLIRAVLHRRLAPMNAARLAMLDAVEAAHSRPLPLPAMLRAFVWPIIEMKAAHPDFAALIGHVHVSPDPALQAFFFAEFAEVHDRFTPAVVPHFPPELPPARVVMRMQFVAGMIVMMLTGDPFADHVAGGKPANFGPTELLDEFVSCATATIRAPLATHA